MTSPTTAPTGAPPEADPLADMNLEESDRMDSSVVIATMQSEIRALSGQALAGLAPGVPRIDAVNPILDENNAHLALASIAMHLFNEARLGGPVQILVQMVQRFNALLGARLAGNVDPNALAETVIVGRALLDTVYEQIKQTDLEEIAANIAENSLPNFIVPGIAPPRLNQQGIDLLNRLRTNNANPSKVILAFSAALDLEHFDPQVPGIVIPPLPLGFLPRLNLNTDVLHAPEGGLNAEIYRRLEALACAVEKYEQIPTTQLRFREPGAAPSGKDSGIAQGKHQDMLEKYQAACDLLSEVRYALIDLQAHLGGLGAIPPSLAGVALLVPAHFDQTGAPPDREIRPPSAVRAPINGAITGGMLKADEYKKRITDTSSQGLTGADACDAILTEYIRRVGRVDGATAKIALSSLTGRAMTAREDIRRQRTELAAVEADPHAARQVQAFNKRNADGAGFFNVFGGRFGSNNGNVHQMFLNELNQQHSLGLQGSAMTCPLDQLKRRYFALKHLSELAPDAERFLPLTQQLATELTELRDALIDRLTKNVTVIMQRNRSDRLSEEDARKAGLGGQNLENLPFRQIQDRIVAMLEGEPDSKTQAQIQTRIDRAWHPIGHRAGWVRWRRNVAKGTFGGVVESGKGVVGRSKYTLANVAGVPVWGPFWALKKAAGGFSSFHRWGMTGKW
jgi:hypothetical protein